MHIGPWSAHFWSTRGWRRPLCRRLMDTRIRRGIIGFHPSIMESWAWIGRREGAQWANQANSLCGPGCQEGARKSRVQSAALCTTWLWRSQSRGNLQLQDVCTNGSRVKLCTTRNIYSFRYLLRRQSAVTSCRCFSIIRSSAPMSDKNGDQGGICWCRDEKPGRDPSRSRMRIMSCRGRICADLEIRISTSANHFSVMLLVPIG